MTKDEVYHATINAIREEVGDPGAPVSGQSTSADIPGWDSLAHVRIVFNIAVRLDTDIDPSITYEAATVDDMVETIYAAASQA